MSSTEALGGAGAGGPGGSGGHKRGRPFGSKNKVKDPAATPLVSRKCGRPLGSRNKKTLAALAAAATTDSAGAGHAATAAAAPTGAVAAATTAATPVKAAAAIVTATIFVGASPLVSQLRPPVAQLVPPPPWCASPGAHRCSSGSPIPRSTGSPPSWPIFGLGTRCACRFPSGSSTPWG
jgi:hypothetical protein